MAWYDVVSTGNVHTAAQWNDLVSWAGVVSWTSGGHDHDGTDSVGTLNPTTITCSGAIVGNGAWTIGNADDNVTVNCGTGTLSVNADRFLYDLDSTNSTDGININRNYAGVASASVMTIVQDNTADINQVLRLQQDGTGYAIYAYKTYDGTNGAAYIEDSSGGASTNYIELCSGGNASRRTGYFYRNLASANTATPVVAIVQDNAGDDQAALNIQQDGSAPGIIVTSTTNLSAGIRLVPQALPPASAVEGDIYADTDNHLYYYNGTAWKQLDNA